MSTIIALADFVSRTSFDSLPGVTVSHVKQHLLDNLGAMLAGIGTAEGGAAVELVTRLWPGGDLPVIGYPFKASLLPAIVATCAAARCTEVDDIHQGSCTTPGSVIVPTALALARAGHFVDPPAFLCAITVGYDILVRLGLAMDGARVLYSGLWPTYMAAAMGSAAVAAKALKLDTNQTAHACAAALTMATGTSGRNRGRLSIRWLTLGIAAQNGVIAALAAREGLEGDVLLLDRDTGPLQGVIIRPEQFLEGLGRRFCLDETGMKPYPVARQTLSAVEAFRQIMDEERIDPGAIRQVTVRVPGLLTGMIDNRNLPGTRLESIVSVQYQMAVAALHPARLFDVAHEPYTEDPRVGVLMAKIAVQRAPELDHYFPEVWPARVEVVSEQGTMSRELLYPKGDPANRLDRDELRAKFLWVAGPSLGEARATHVIRYIEGIDTGEILAPLWDLLA